VPEQSSPTLVVVSGPPGSGKTTLAHAIARELPCPAICRDEIKEGMVHATGGEFQGAWGDELTRRTFPLFFEVLRVLLEAGVTVVGEAAFQDGLWQQGLEPLGVPRIRIVQCRADPAVTWARATSRSAAKPAHATAHGDSTLGKRLEDWASAAASFERISLPVPAIDVDTAHGYDPGLPEIVAFVNRP
jgi:predicted kinase